MNNSLNGVNDLFSPRGRIMRAMRRATAFDIDVSLLQMHKQWVAAVDGDVAHINDLPKLVEEAIARRA